MPYNGSGTFAVYTPGTPYVTGTTISSTVANNVNSDFATGLSTAITKDGQTTATAAIPFAVGLSSAALVDISAAAAGQIKFPAVENASANANTLDDYEEGTWTPSIGGTATYTVQHGTYVKIGRRVFFQGQLTVNSIGTGSTTTISGLPFTSASNFQNSVAVSAFTSLSQSVVFISGSVGAAATTITFNGIAVAGASISTGITIFQNSASITFSGAYNDV